MTRYLNAVIYLTPFTVAMFIRLSWWPVNGVLGQYGSRGVWVTIRGPATRWTTWTQFMARAERGSECSHRTDTGTHPASCPLVFQVDYWGLSQKGLSGRGVKLTFNFYLVAMSRRVELFIHLPINKVCSNRWSCSCTWTCNRVLLRWCPKWLTDSVLTQRITLDFILKFNTFPKKGGKYISQDFATK